MYKLKTIILYLVLLCLTPIAQAEELIFQWQPPFDKLTNAIGKSPEAVLKQLKSNPPEKSQSNLFKAQYHGVLSEVFYSLSYPHEALEHAQIGLTLINGQSQPWLYHNLKLQEANAYDLVGSPSSGMKGANAAIVWAQLNDIPELLVDALFVRGGLRISLVDYTGALTDLQQAYDIAPDNGPGLSKGNVASMLALVYEYRQEDQLSIPFFQEAAQYSRENGETLELSIALYGLGRAYKNIGKTQEGRELLLESKQLAREVGDEQGVGYALKELAGIAIAEQRLETAETLLQEALGIFLTSQNRYLLVACYRTLVILSIMQDQLEQGENYLNAAYEQIDPQTMPIQKLDLDEVKARFLAAKGKHKQAYDLLQTTVAPRQEYYSQQSTQQLHSLRSRYEIDVKERENELLAQQNRLQQENLNAAETQNLQLMLLFGATLIICALLVVMAYRTKQNRAQLESLANTDGLTGLANRRRCLELLDVQIQLSSRHQHGLSVAIVDIDFFKRINDQYGHQVGDKVLRAFGDLCLKTFRSSDVVGRIGGEEFLIALPHTQLNDAYNSLKSLSLKVKALSRELQVEGLVISISVGLALLQKDMDQEAILLKCDEALYQAKNQGRDQICLAPLEEDS